MNQLFQLKMFILNTYSFDNRKDYKGLDNKENTPFNKLLVFPNPADNLLFINYNISFNGNIKISISNIFGEEISEIVNNYCKKGYYNKIVSLKTYPSGFYSIKMISDNNNFLMTKFVVVR